MQTYDMLLGLVLGALLGLALGGFAVARLLRASQPDPALEADVIRESLDRLYDQIRDQEHSRASWQGQFAEQVEQMRHATEGLGKETRSLTSALRKPQVRGRWGELHLRRAVELAGLVEHCDFTEQERLRDGAQRPDLVVRLAGERRIVVDAKVPLEGFLDATSAEDDALREHHLDRHARQLRTHIDSLGSKAYWRSLPESTEFVVLFVPAESFLSAGLERQRDLIEYAAGKDVILASPTTLIALLRTVAHGWRHEALSREAAQIHARGRELYERLGNFAGHLDQVGRSLNAAVGHYNHAMGSLESRVLVSARRFEDLSGPGASLETPRQVESAARRATRRGDDDPPRLAI
ncbi:MAG: DNA recombination protein RmuC [Nocardioides sp.]|jgi:DNA recombination protein RmuC